eukprot:6824249-Prorocentrum_lima.AAC.1
MPTTRSPCSGFPCRSASSSGCSGQTAWRCSGSCTPHPSCTCGVRTSSRPDSAMEETRSAASAT